MKRCGTSWRSSCKGSARNGRRVSRADPASSSRQECGRRRWGLAGEVIAQGVHAVVELVDGLFRFGEAVPGAGVAAARGFGAQVGAEGADNPQPAGAEPARDQVDAEGLGVDPLADVEAGLFQLQALVLAGRVAGPGDVAGQAGETVGVIMRRSSARNSGSMDIRLGRSLGYADHAGADPATRVADGLRIIVFLGVDDDRPADDRVRAV